MGTALSSGLAVVGVMVCLALLGWGARRPARRDPKTGELILQCGPGVLWLTGGIAVLGPLGSAALAFLIPFKNDTQVFVPIGLGAFFLLIGGPMSLWAVRRRTRIGETGLTSEGVFGGRRFLAWEDVQKVTFASGQEFWVRGPKHKAMLHVWFIGLREAVPLLRKHLPAQVLKKNGSVLDTFAARVGAD